MPGKPPERTPEGDALTDLVLPVFELNAEFLATAAAITAPHGLTPAQWQVLGAAVDTPLSVSELARRIGLGLTRQSVQRVANDVVERGWARWRENPQHQRAKLLEPTAAGRCAVAAMVTEQHAWADHVGSQIGAEDLATLRTLITRLIEKSRARRDTPMEAGQLARVAQASRQ